jgi:hypothetical protein
VILRKWTRKVAEEDVQRGNRKPITYILETLWSISEKGDESDGKRLPKDRAGGGRIRRGR